MNLHDTSKTKFTQLRANIDTIFNQMAIKLVISPLFEMLIHVVRMPLIPIRQFVRLFAAEKSKHKQLQCVES